MSRTSIIMLCQKLVRKSIEKVKGHENIVEVYGVGRRTCQLALYKKIMAAFNDCVSRFKMKIGRCLFYGFVLYVVLC